MELLKINQEEKILIVAPHPDDECIGTGGLLCCFPQNCFVLVMTDGALGQKNLSLNECRKIRKVEFTEEMNFLGIDKYTFLDIPDGDLINNTNCLFEYDLKQYDKIFVTSYEDGHLDHTVAFTCVIEALNRQNVDTEVYLYEVHKQLSNPTHYIDITECIDKKEKAISYHKSQIISLPYDRLSRVNGESRALQNRHKDAFYEVFSKYLPKTNCEMKTLALENDLQKFKMFYQLLTRWMMQDDSTFEKFLQEKEIKKCAVYGYAELGQILTKRLRDNGISVEYILDKKIKDEDVENLKVLFPSKKYGDVDIVFVTAVYQYDDICKELQKLGYINIISLYEVIMNL